MKSRIPTTIARFALGMALAVPGSVLRAQDTGAYASAGVAHATTDGSELGDFDGNSGHLQLRLGYAFNRYLAIEAEGSLAVLKPELRDPAEGSRLILDRYAAAFAVARLPVGDRVTLHARGGYYTGTVPLEAQGARETENFDDWAYGLGLSYHWDRNAIRADYTVLTGSLDNGEGPTLNHRLIGIAFVHSF